MTCDEFNQTRLTTNPLTAPIAVVAAMVKHARHCPACMAMVKAELAKATSKMGLLENLKSELIAEHLRARVKNDPEGHATAME